MGLHSRLCAHPDVVSGAYRFSAQYLVFIRKTIVRYLNICLVFVCIRSKTDIKLVCACTSVSVRGYLSSGKLAIHKQVLICGKWCMIETQLLHIVNSKQYRFTLLCQLVQHFALVAKIIVLKRPNICVICLLSVGCVQLISAPVLQLISLRSLMLEV